MPVVKNRFKNPADNSTYTWQINHNEEAERGVESQYGWSSSTGGAALPQYGGLKAQVWTLRGTILHRAQHDAFKSWAAIAKDHTIYFRDFDNVEYEVAIVNYAPTRVRVEHNRMDPTMPHNIYRYELQLLVYGVVA